MPQKAVEELVTIGGPYSEPEMGDTQTDDTESDKAADEKETETKETAKESETSKESKEDTSAKAETQDSEEENVTISKAELEKLRKQVAEKEKFIQKQGTEVGKSRKELAAAQKSLEALQRAMPVDDEAERDRLNELAQTDPVAFNEQWEKHQKQKRDLESKQQEVNRLIAIEANNKMIEEHIPDLADHIDAIAGLMKEDGTPAHEWLQVAVKARREMGLELREELLLSSDPFHEWTRFSREKGLGLWFL